MCFGSLNRVGKKVGLLQLVVCVLDAYQVLKQSSVLDLVRWQWYFCHFEHLFPLFWTLQAVCLFVWHCRLYRAQTCSFFVACSTMFVQTGHCEV